MGTSPTWVLLGSTRPFGCAHPNPMNMKGNDWRRIRKEGILIFGFRKSSRRILKYRGRSISIWLTTVIWAMVWRQPWLFCQRFAFIHLPRPHLTNLTNSLNTYQAFRKQRGREVYYSSRSSILGKLPLLLEMPPRFCRPSARSHQTSSNLQLRSRARLNHHTCFSSQHPSQAPGVSGFQPRN